MNRDYLTNRKLVIEALYQMIVEKCFRSRHEICCETGVSHSYFQCNPVMQRLYEEAIKEAHGNPSTFHADAKKILKARAKMPGYQAKPRRFEDIRNIKIVLPDDILKKLRSRDVDKRREGIREVAEMLGLATARAEASLKNWNKTVEWLDVNYSGWRGYPNPHVRNPALLEVVA